MDKWHISVDKLGETRGKPQCRYTAPVDTISLPLPPSGNRYYRKTNRGFVYKSQEARIYQSHVGYLTTSIKPTDGDIALTVHCFFEDRRRDLDNTLKVLFDALEGRVYHNDRQIKEIHAYWHLDKAQPRVEVSWDTL